ncbi:hypothetical protein M2480_002759 [Parabacteroides sp. PFB2-12]|uniref:DUF4221 family protein n=1 Tax=unclassified Parabacteroides TaxID=2649774 RepID=UPI0024744D2D|nr:MULTISPECIES: DUF4221 family protein [unclassified Parabacteroides]MDH6342629.1 hypothetical protein [Parabacteroides sp. PM6-13]MDH6391757.1 hypothetical protein [Parabacteroides sp. PFB2-12]
MIKYNYLLLLLLFISLIGCREKKTTTIDSFSLVKGDALSFELDNRTRTLIGALFPYTDKDGTEYLTFQNQGQNDLLFYNMNTQELAFKLQPPYEGSNGVGDFIGYHIHNLDSLFLTVWGHRIVMIDRNLAIKDKYEYNMTHDSLPLARYHSMSSTPIYILDNKLYIMPGGNRWADLAPVCATIDLTDKSVKAFTSFTYPSFPGADNKMKRSSTEDEVSRMYNGEQFVYAFYYDEDIYLASRDHSDIKRIKIKSRYIPKVKILDDYGNVTPEGACANPNYGNMLYDPYRKVYYRVAYPEVEIEQGIKGMELLSYGRKRFSIIIVDEAFQVIGETLFPDYIYNSRLMFVREDGLYISNSHYMNPAYSDDILSFDRFELVKN